MQRFRDEVVKGTGAEFVAAKLKERDERHARAGASRFMVEPNVKEGKGGLRDLHTLFWIAQLPASGRQPRRSCCSSTCSSGREVRAFIRAFDFLEAVRAHLHFATGRPEERLSFDLQPEIARRMGYDDRAAPDGDNTPAVERFMRRYFLIAREVGALTRAFCRQAGGRAPEDGAARPVALPAAAGRARRKPLDEPGFHIEGGRLTVDGPETFERRSGQPAPAVQDRRRARPRPAPGRLHRRHPRAAA